MNALRAAQTLRHWPLILVTCSAMLCAACSAGAELTESGRRVTFVTSPMDVSGCEKAGEVEGNGIPADHSDEAAKTTAIHELRNAAAEKGGTHVLVEESRDLKKGKVYRCP